MMQIWLRYTQILGAVKLPQSTEWEALETIGKNTQAPRALT